MSPAPTDQLFPIAQVIGSGAEGDYSQPLSAVTDRIAQVFSRQGGAVHVIMFGYQASHRLIGLFGQQANRHLIQDLLLARTRSPELRIPFYQKNCIMAGKESPLKSC